MAQTYADGGIAGNVYTRGPGQHGQKLSVYGQEATQGSAAIGERVIFDDGRVFRYAHFVSAVGVGKLAAQDASVTNTASLAGKYVNSAGTATDYTTDATTVYLKDTDTFTTDDAADVYAGGYLHVTDDQGEGFTYRIKSNAAGTAAGLMRLDLYDNLQLAINSESSAQLTGSLYRNLAISNNGTDDNVVGLAMRSVTAGYYAWVQTWGVGTVLADESAGTVAAGTIAQVSDGVNGAAQPFGGGAINSENDHSYDTEPVIGYFLGAAADTEYVPIYLQICP